MTREGVKGALLAVMGCGIAGRGISCLPVYGLMHITESMIERLDTRNEVSRVVLATHAAIPMSNPRRYRSHYEILSSVYILLSTFSAGFFTISSISSPATVQHRQIPLIHRLLNQLVDRRLHAETLAQLPGYDGQRAIRLARIVDRLLVRQGGHPLRRRGRRPVPSSTVLLALTRLALLLHALQAERADGPRVQGIVAQDVEDGHDGILVLAQGLEGEVAAAAEDALDAGEAHAVDDVARQPEGDHFRDGQDPAGLEGDAEVDVHHFSRLLVEQDVVAVAVADAEDVAEDRDGGRGARVGEPFGEPVVRVEEAFEEEVAEHGLEVVADVSEGLDAVREGSGLRVCDFFAASVGLPVLGEVFLVGGK